MTFVLQEKQPLAKPQSGGSNSDVGSHPKDHRGVVRSNNGGISFGENKENIPNGSIQSKKVNSSKLDGNFEQLVNQSRLDISNETKWVKMCRRLVAYKRKHGQLNVISNEDPKLQAWVRNQRKTCNKKHRIDLLNDIGFEWNADQTEPRTYHDDWMEMYQRLVAYTERNGTARVPTKYKGDPKLGNWVSWQRQTCKDKRRIDLLDALGFQWQVDDDTWMNMYGRLVAYKAKHGTYWISGEDPKLKNWVKDQRQYCTQKRRVDLLNAIGFEWEKQSTWMDMYDLLVEYKKTFGTTCVEVDREESTGLAKWVDTQRFRCKEADRVGLLNKIGFEW